MLDRETREKLHWDTPEEAVIHRETLFASWQYTEGDIRLPYRLFVPEVEVGAAVPMLVYLHGVDDRGTDGRQHLRNHDSGCIFAMPECQRRHPAYILAPQCPEDKFWKSRGMIDVLFGLIHQVAEEQGNVDMSRLYLYGSSMGGIGALELLKKKPGFIAAALIICGATLGNNLEALRETPMWFFHSVGDEIVNPREGEVPGGKAPFLGSFALAERLHQMGKENLRSTVYPAGYLMEKYGINPHCAWIPALRDEEVKEWLFGQKLAQKR